MVRSRSHPYEATVSRARRAFGLLAAVSLLLCLCSIVVWANSSRWHHVLTINAHRFSIVFEEHQGGLFWRRDSTRNYYDSTQSIILTSNEPWELLPPYARVREAHPSGWLLDEPEYDGQFQTQAGWVPLAFLCAAFAVVPLIWAVIWMKVRHDANPAKRGASLHVAPRLERWAVRSSIVAMLIVAFLWIESARWYECESDVGSGWAIHSMPRECALIVIHFVEETGGTAPTLGVSWWPARPDNATANPIVLQLFSKFEYQPIVDGSSNLFGPPTTSTVIGHSLTLPYWFLFLAAALLPTWQAGSLMRRFVVERKRQQTGCCLRCGYDLRASATGCPECGNLVQPSVSDEAALKCFRSD